VSENCNFLRPTFVADSVTGHYCGNAEQMNCNTTAMLVMLSFRIHDSMIAKLDVRAGHGVHCYILPVFFAPAPPRSGVTGRPVWLPAPPYGNFFLSAGFNICTQINQLQQTVADLDGCRAFGYVHTDTMRVRVSVYGSSVTHTSFTCTSGAFAVTCTST